MACSTVGRYKGREVNPQEVGRDLNVRTVMTGKVLQLRDTLIIRTELVDVATGVQLWGEQYSRKLSDILALEEVISRDISEKLLIKLTADEQVRLHRRQTSNAEAYQLFLKGRYFWNKRTEEGLKKSIEYFQRAIEKDPGYAAAYAGMSDCYILLVGEHGLPAQEGLTKAKTAAIKALEIDGTLADAHTSLAHAMLHNWEWAEAEIELKRAIELDAEDPVARQVYYEYLSATGRVEEALIEMKKAQEIDPLSLAINSNVAAALYFARQYDRAIEQCQKILEMDPTFYWANWNLGRVYEQKGMFAEAIAELAKAVEMSRGNAHLLASLGYAYAVAGRIQDAQDVLSVLIGKSEPNPASPYDIAMIYVGLGENDRAFEWLERAYRERDGMMTHLKVTPRIDPLRSDPRFEDLMRRIGLI
jgi:tetratricopeptide (TPR) repeat protein